VASQLKHNSSVCGLVGVEVHRAGRNAGIALEGVAGLGAQRLLLLRLLDDVHGCVVLHGEVELLELADEPALVPGHGQLVGEAGQALVANEADDVKLSVETGDTIAVESLLCQRFLTFLFQAATSKYCAEVRKKVILIVLSVTKHLC